MSFMAQEFTDLLIEAGLYSDGRVEIVLNDMDRNEHQAITVNQDPEEVADRLEHAADCLRSELGDE